LTYSAITNHKTISDVFYQIYFSDGETSTYLEMDAVLECAPPTSGRLVAGTNLVGYMSCLYLDERRLLKHELEEAHTQCRMSKCANTINDVDILG